MTTRAFIMTALVLCLAPAFRAVAGEGREGEPTDPREVKRLLAKAELSRDEAVALLALPEALQRKALTALAGEGAGVFDTAEWILLRTLPEALQARIRNGGRREKAEEGVRKGEREKGRGGEGVTPSPRRPIAPSGDAEEKKPYPLQDVKTDLLPFGARMFAREAEPMPLAPTIPVPSDYVLGPGDMLLVHYWSALVDTTYTPEITAEGRITIPRGGEVTLGGLTMEAGQKLLERRIREMYKDAGVTVSLHSLRSIRVFVAGEVVSPGLHTLPALSTVLHALYVAGGPSMKGSYRRIRVIRVEKTVAEVDLYDFFRAGRRKGDIRLLAGDTVFVPLAGTRVTAAGKVRRPAVYELRDEKSLADVLALAGGVEPGGFTGAIRLERRRGDRLTLLDVKADPASVPVQDGDTVKVFPLYPDPLESVEVSGCVERPGRYRWTEGMKVSGLLALAGRLLPDATTAYAEIRRKLPPDSGTSVEAGGRRFHPAWKLVRIDLARVLQKDSEADLPLEPLDRLHVLSLSEVNPRLTVEILGAVEKPGVVEYAEGMRLLDLLHRDGQGLSPDAHLGRAEIIRLTAEGQGYVWAQGTEKTSARTETIAVNLKKALAGDPEANPLLLPFDVVKVYRAEEVRPAPTVTVLGAVGSPGAFELSSGMRVSDLVFRAGNITANAYLAQAEILRRTYDASAQATYKLTTLSLDLGKALQGDRKHDVPLENFDRLIVRRTSDYFVEVEVKGQVRFPGTYLMPKGARLTDLIDRAGGYTKEAYLSGAFFTREELRVVQEKAKERFITDQKAKMIELEGQAQAMASDAQARAQISESVRTRRLLLEELESTEVAGRLAIRLDQGAEFTKSPHNLVLRHGDGLSIPETPVSVTVQGNVFAPGSVLHTEGKRLEYYVNQVGGMKEDADEDRIYLVKADGRAYSRSAESAFAVRWDSDNLRWVRNRLGRVVDPGDVVMVPPKRIVVSGSDLTKDVVDILYKIALSAGVLAGIAG